MSKAHAISEDLKANREETLSVGQFDALDKALTRDFVFFLIFGFMLLGASAGISIVFREGVINEPKQVLTWVWLLFILISLLVSFSFFQQAVGILLDKSEIRETLPLESIDGALEIKTGYAYLADLPSPTRYNRYYVEGREHTIYPNGLFTTMVPEKVQEVSFKESNGSKITTEKIRIYYLTLHYKSVHPFWSFEKSPMIINYEKAG